MADEQSVFWDDLAKDLEDPEFLRTYIVESIRIASIDRLINELDEARDAAGLNKAEVARAINAEPAVVRRLFGTGPVNPTLATVAEVAAALGLRLTVEKLPAAERKLVTEPLLTGRTRDPKALADAMAVNRNRGTERKSAQKKPAAV